MSSSFRVEDKWCEGHFPGHPILPGVAQLALMLEHLDPRASLAAIRFLRLRRLVHPGEVLDYRYRGSDEIRVELKCGGALVSSAHLVLGPLTAAQRCAPDVKSGAHHTAVPLSDLLPHQPPMRFVSGIIEEREDGLVCFACIPAQCPLVHAGSAPAFAGIEVAAQTAAVWEALRRWQGGGGAAARVGYLVGVRDVALFAQRVPAAATLRASIRLAAAMPPLTHYDIEVTLEDALLLRGSIATVITDQAL